MRSVQDWDGPALENLRVVPLDVTSDESVSALMRTIEENENRGVDILINNAGIGVAGCLELVDIQVIPFWPYLMLIIWAKRRGTYQILALVLLMNFNFTSRGLQTYHNYYCSKRKRCSMSTSGDQCAWCKQCCPQCGEGTMDTSSTWAPRQVGSTYT